MTPRRADRLIVEFGGGDDEGGMYGGGYGRRSIIKGFLDPFVDVFKVAAKGGKDVANRAVFAAKALVTVSKRRFEEIRGEYTARKNAILKEREALMAPINKSLGGDNQVTIGFLLNPGLYLAARGLYKTKDAAIALKKFAASIGITSPSDVDKLATKREKTVGTDAVVMGKNFVRDLKKVFFVESVDVGAGQIISEASDGEERDVEVEDVSARLAREMREIGIAILRAKADEIDEALLFVRGYAQALAKLEKDDSTNDSDSIETSLKFLEEMCSRVVSDDLDDPVTASAVRSMSDGAAVIKKIDALKSALNDVRKMSTDATS